MYTTYSKREVQRRVMLAIAEKNDTPVTEMAREMQISEGAITFALPDSMVTSVSADKAAAVLDELSTWGALTTIVHSHGSIFEVKAPLPKGKIAHGYYNLMGKSGELQGHLKLDKVGAIALVSKPFRGNESHYIGFFTHEGQCVFKTYLGRDEKRQLMPQQIDAFNTMKQEFTQ